MTDPPRAVLDSSVLVPAWSRLLLSTLASARPALYTPVWCEWIIVSHTLHDFPPRDSDGICAYAGIEFITAENFVGDVLGLDPTPLAPRPVPPSGRITHQRRL